MVNIISGNIFIFSTRSSGHQQRVFFDFRFSSRKSQSQQKLAKKSTYFTIQFHSNNLTHFTNLTTQLTLKITCSRNTAKNLSHFTDFPANMFLFGVKKKIFALHHFLAPKNCIVEALWKQISAYFCISL